MESSTSSLVFYVNGKKVMEENPDPELTLLTFLRTKLLPGTKLACGEGGCGACTVMVSRYDRSEKQINHFSVNACLAPVCGMHGLAVTTVEGIGSVKTGLHPVQERIAKSFGSQCGFCTPGIVMSMYTLLRNNPEPTRQQMESAFEGNLCRCTGYRPILDGFNTFTKEFKCAMGDDCCQNKSKTVAMVETHGKIFDVTEFSHYDPSQEPIFPSELQISDSYDSSSVMFKGSRVTWHRPITLDELVALKAAHPTARIIIGNTEVGIEVKFKRMHYPVLIAATHIPELLAVRHEDTGIVFGASTSLTTMEKVLHKAISQEPEYKTRVFAAIVEMLRWFAGHQIRNVAAIAGNIMTASPISDLNPLFLAAGCTLDVISKEGGKRTIKMDRNFFLGYRKTAVKPEEVLVTIHIPFTGKNEYFAGFKQAQRREDDISIVNGGMRVILNEDLLTVEDLALSFGGMAPITKMATKTMKGLIGLKWDDNLLQEACILLENDLPMPPGTPGGTESYRRTLTTSFFYKFYLTVLKNLQNKEGCPTIPQTHMSATDLYHREPSKGVQLYEQPGPHQVDDDAVGRPLPHLAAQQQATGEAQYIDDIPKRENELYLALVMSTKAKARLLSVDPEAALTMPGVKSYICRDDILGNSLTGPTGVKDDVIFAKNEVTCEGQVIGAIVAETQDQAQRAARAVNVQYEVQDPIITIEQAIAADSFFEEKMHFKKGDVEGALKNASHILEGEVKIGGQEHFYMETQTTLAIPRGEDGEMEIYCSTQSPTYAQTAVASALGISANRVTIRTKRIGGGFGGKETQFCTVLLPVAIAANKLNKPVRCMLDREEDMTITGTRHPFLGRYKVGFDDDGRITALDVQLYSNAGNSHDLSIAIMGRAGFHISNAYCVPNLRVTGRMCKTNISSNTAFRGFGVPQGKFVCESIVSDIALQLNKKQEEIREINLVRDGYVTHYGQTLENCKVQQCWDEVIEKAEFVERRKEIDEYNRRNRWKKRGISVVPLVFGVGFNFMPCNQGGALVHVYTDGSVLVSHGGVEMGQGLHSKMIQVASRALGVPIQKIHITETSTATVPNTSATAASVSSDLNGMAIMYACRTILDRLASVKETMTNATWEELVSEAYSQRISLSSTGLYRTPDISFDDEKCEGHIHAYYSFGAACSEVEIDCLTGDHTALRTDIVMDVGQSLNPGIDIGQIPLYSGQYPCLHSNITMPQLHEDMIASTINKGQGLFTLEFQRYSPSGNLYSRGPGFYKIPSTGDIPIEFNVSLLKESANERAVYSSKAIGEPPLFLAASIFFAIKEAVTAARAENDVHGPFRFDSPATSWRIRMACQDQFTEQFPEPDPKTYTPWFVEL